MQTGRNHTSHRLLVGLLLTCCCHFLTEEHKVDLVQGDVLQGVVGVGDVGPDPGRGPVQEAPVRQGGGAGRGVSLHQLVTDFPETLNGPANHTEVSGAMVLINKHFNKLDGNAKIF